MHFYVLEYTFTLCFRVAWFIYNFKEYGTGCVLQAFVFYNRDGETEKEYQGREENLRISFNILNAFVCNMILSDLNKLLQSIPRN